MAASDGRFTSTSKLRSHKHPVTDFFSPDYFTARDRFRSGVLSNAGQIESILLNAKGPGEEDLTIDIGWFGSPEPKRALIHSSGMHGVEGFAGSAIQLQWLERSPAKPPHDGAVVIVHVMNPYGMAWLRRANENNVELNRNFPASDEKYEGAPESYEALNSFLNPPSPPARDFFLPRAIYQAMRYGMPALRRAIVDGQYDFPEGLSFGGKRREQAARRFQLYISGKLAHAEQVVAIDVHTGPGCLGGASGDRKGSLEGLYRRMFPAARVSFSIQAFASCSPMAALAALRSENRQHHYGDSSVLNKAKSDLLEAFCPAGGKWRQQVLEQGREVIAQGLAQAFD